MHFYQMSDQGFFFNYVPAHRPTFSLEDVDRNLRAKRAFAITGFAPSPPLSSSGSSAPSDTSSPADTSSLEPQTPPSPNEEEVRSIKVCIDVFENGPKPVSLSLALLSDEKVILLANHGKIAAYALEKLLGMDELERAVRIRRALISRASNSQTLEASDIPLSN